MPRKEGALPLGETGSIAERRLFQNEKSLQRKNKFAEFQEQVNDYGKRRQAELVPTENMSKPNSEVAYLPLHGVEKSTSFTTKLRVVSDASAKSSTGVSLNDTLLPGPSLYPPLTTLLLRFRTYNIAVSADCQNVSGNICAL